MYAALFEMDSMFGKHQYIFEGKNAEAILIAFEYEQSLECLIRHGRYEEDAKGQLELDRLEAVYNKYINGTVTMDDLASLDVKLSVGTIQCLSIVEGAEAIAELKAQNPKARQG